MKLMNRRMLLLGGISSLMVSVMSCGGTQKRPSSNSKELGISEKNRDLSPKPDSMKPQNPSYNDLRGYLIPERKSLKRQSK